MGVRARQRRYLCPQLLLFSRGLGGMVWGLCEAHEDGAQDGDNHEDTEEEEDAWHGWFGVGIFFSTGNKNFENSLFRLVVRLSSSWELKVKCNLVEKKLQKKIAIYYPAKFPD